MSKDAKLATILEAPTLTAADKTAIVAELEKSAGTGAGGETVKNFLQTLAENNRLSLLGGVCTKFNELMSAARGEVEMTVTSAQVCYCCCSLWDGFNLGQRGRAEAQTVLLVVSSRVENPRTVLHDMIHVG